MTNIDRSLMADRFGAFAQMGHLRRPHSAHLVLPLYAVGLFGSVLFALCYFGAVDVSAAMATAVLITLTASPAIAALTVQGYDLFSPFQLVAGYFLLYYGARVAYLQLNPTALRLGLLEYDDYLPTAAWLAALTFIAFVVGYSTARSERPAKYLLRLCPRLPRHPPIIRLIIVASLGMFAHLYILSYGIIIGRTYTQSGMREMTENPIPGWLPPCAGLLEISFCVATIYAMSSDVPMRDRRVCRWFGLSCFVLIVFKTVSQGIREYVLLALALWVFCHHYRRRRIGAVAVAVVLAGGMLVFNTFYVLRGTLTLRAPQTIGDLSGLVTSSIDAFASLSTENIANIAVAPIFDRSQGIDSLSLVVKYTPERAPWGLGSSYISIPVQLFVPRALWADKPVLNTHQEFERTYMGIHVFAQASTHVFADLYSNFAVAGLVAGGFVFGLAFKYFYVTLIGSVGRKEILVVYSYLMLQAMHKLEADFVGGMVIMVRAIIMIAFTLVFLSFGKNQTSTTGASA